MSPLLRRVLNTERRCRKALLSPIARVRAALRARSYRGHAVTCPVCDGTFASWVRGVAAGRCPGCGSRSRQRLLWLYLRDKLVPPFGGATVDKLRVLHFAPEECLVTRLRSMPAIEYVTCDLYKQDVDRCIDITAIALPDAWCDVVLCSHVLEHVLEDVGAMRELLRITRPNGRVLIQVPMNAKAAATFEDATVVSEADRLRVFGQRDHVRIYGRDFPQRLRTAGFDVRLPGVFEGLPEPDRARYGLRDDDQIYDCVRA